MKTGFHHRLRGIRVQRQDGGRAGVSAPLMLDTKRMAIHDGPGNEMQVWFKEKCFHK